MIIKEIGNRNKKMTYGKCSFDFLVRGKNDLQKASCPVHLFTLVSCQGVTGTVLPSSQFRVEMKSVLSGTNKHHPFLALSTP